MMAGFGGIKAKATLIKKGPQKGSPMLKPAFFEP